MEALDPDSEAAAALASPGKVTPKEEDEDEDDFAAQVPVPLPGRVPVVPLPSSCVQQPPRHTQIGCIEGMPCLQSALSCMHRCCHGKW